MFYNFQMPMMTQTRLMKQQHSPKSIKSQQKHSKDQSKNIEKLKNQKKQKEKSKVVNFFKLYRFAQKYDYMLVVIGIIFSIVTGVGLPFFAIIAGKMVDAFDLSGDKMIQQTNEAKNLFLFIGMGTFFAGWIAFTTWSILGQRLAMKCRKQYLKNLMKQDASYFEGIKEQVISQQFSVNILKFRDALGLKVGTFIFIAASLIAGGRNAISTGWQLSIVIVSTLPILGLSGVLYSFLVQLKKSTFLEHYSKADQKVKQATQYIKTVKSLNGQKHELSLYQKYLEIIKQKVVLFSLFAGFGSGWFAFVQFGVYALAFWYGSHCVQGSIRCPNSEEDKYTAGEVIVIFFAFYVRLDSMQQLLPSLRKIYGGMEAAFWLYQLIDKSPQVTSHSSQTIQMLKFKGVIQFKDVTFLHPRDKTKIILNKISFKINSLFTAFHGRNQEKQAIQDLIMRFHDPDEGQIFLDGINLQYISLDWLRMQFGYLDTQARVFEGSIKQNINCGTISQTQNLKTNQDQIWKILRNLQLQNTINLYKNQLQSNIGYLGKKLNQVQRKKIDIAKLFIKGPKIIIIKEFLPQVSEQQQFQTFLNFQKLIFDKVIIYTGTNERILKKCDKIFITSKGQISDIGTYFTLTKYFQEKVVLQKDIQFLSQSQNNTSIKLSHSHLRLHTTVQEQILQEPIHSLSPQKIALNYEETNKKKFGQKVFDMLFYYTKNMKIVYYLGLFISFLCGLLYPIFSIFLADTLLDIFKFKNYPAEQSFIRQQITNPIYAMLYIGAFAFVLNFLQIFIFSVVAQKIGQKMRIETYEKVLKLPVEWFISSPENSSFKTSQHLKYDPPNSIGLPTQFYSIIVKNSTSAIAGIIIAFIFQWRLALLGIFVIPFMMLSGFLSSVFYFGLGDESQNKYSQSASVITQAIINIKSIKIYKAEQIILKNYQQRLKQPWKYSIKRANMIGLTLATSQFIIFASFTIMFFLGSLFLKDNPNSISRLQLFSAIFAVIWPGWTSGSNFFVMPNIELGKKAASSIFRILQQEDQHQMQIRQKSKLLTSGITGNIYFKNLKVRYPQKKITFQNITFKILPNQQIALFGLPGYGNGPFIDALYRFSQLEEGVIYLDNENIKDYDINYLRSCLGVVSQNPVYFKGTIKQNIIYNMTQISQESVLKVCQISNSMQIINGDQIFQLTIKSTPRQFNNNQNLTQIEHNGLETFLDPKKSQISTNQKQRLAIARTILRNPKILLINDQIPSLSYIFDQKLKKAITKILPGKTSIFMPHYLQTLGNVDNIIFLQNEKAIELGTFQNLQKNTYISQRLKRDFYLY